MRVPTLLLLPLLLPLAAVVPSSAAAAPTCQGERATLVVPARVRALIDDADRGFVPVKRARRRASGRSNRESRDERGRQHTMDPEHGALGVQGWRRG